MNKISCLLIMIGLCTCSLAQEVSQLNWIAGNWEMDGEQTIVENWSLENDSLLTGSSKTIRDGKEVFSETLSIEKRLDSVIYVAVLPFKTAVFKLDSLDKNYASFVDPQNDFPSRIEYIRLGNTMQIILSGDDNKMEMNFVKK